MTWRYVVMANGRGLRWGNHLGIPKHLITIGEETLIQRATRQVLEADPTAEVIISSSDPRCEAVGARRHVPLRNELEIDRFVPELITDQVCFLYGDTFYTDKVMKRIVAEAVEGLHFFLTTKSIVALKSSDSDVLRTHLESVRERFLQRKIDQCKGWQVLDLYSQSGSAHFQTFVADATGDFNTPSDLEGFARSQPEAARDLH